MLRITRKNKLEIKPIFSEEYNQYICPCGNIDIIHKDNDGIKYDTQCNLCKSQINWCSINIGDNL